MRQAGDLVILILAALFCVSPGLAFAQDPPATEPISPSFSRASSQKANLQARLYEEIQQRLGIPYLDGGTDERGFDCSGLIWRVFSQSGVDLKRRSARMLWEELPEADESEQGEFGTLVFFSDLTHVGIVRDSFSFYHASSSQGVTRSFFSDYWGERIVGYRRVPLPPRKQRPRL